MAQKIKVLFCIALFTVILFTATGCFSTESMNPTSSEGDENTPLNLDIDSSSVVSLVATTPDHITASVNGVLEVDASVSVPKIEKAERVATSFRKWTAAEVLPVFFSQPYPQLEVAVHPDTGNEWLYNDVETSGSDEIISFGDGKLSYANMPLFETYEAATNAINSNDGLGSVYPEAKLSFSTPSEAKILVKKYAEGFGISLSDRGAEVNALTADKMNEQAQAYQEMLPPLEKEKDSSGATTVHPYTVEDEAYVVTFYEELKGVPLSRFSYTDAQSGENFGEHEITAYVTKDGIISLNLWNITDNSISVVKEFSTLIPIDEALNRVSEKYIDIIDGPNTKISQIRLEYLERPVSEDQGLSQYDLVWSLSDGVDHQYRNPPIFVNAFTGEVY